MFPGNLAGIMAIRKYPWFRFYTKVTFYSLLTDRMIPGPCVQWYAFGEVWKLTDKILAAFIIWLVVLLINRQKERPVYVVTAIVRIIDFS